MNSEKKGIAIFDFDGTIIKKDSFIEFIRFTHGSLKLYSFYLYSCFYILLYFLKIYPNHRLKERFFTFFYKGWQELKLKQLGSEFSGTLKSFYHKGAQKQLDWHKSASHDIFILTASSEIWLADWCSENGYNLISSKFEVKNGLYTGKIKGINCHGKEKRERIKPILQNYDFKNTYGYGDSKSDLYFLKLLNHIHFGSLVNIKTDRIS